MSEKLMTDFLAKAHRKYGPKFDYSEMVYVNSTTHISISCPMHGVFLQTPKSHLRGIGCPKCGREQRASQDRKTTTQFIREAKEIHGDKYDYSRINYTNSNTKIEIICPIHGVFHQKPTHHLDGHDCLLCGRKTSNLKRTKHQKEILKEFHKAHGNRYDYSKVNYNGAFRKISIICKKHGEFTQTPDHHKRGIGCPRCIPRVSKVESAFLDYLQIPNHPNSRQRYIKEMDIHVDGIKNNIIYEFLGDYYHGNPSVFNPTTYNKICHRTHGELYSRTFERLQRLKDAGYTVKYIWENDWNKFWKGLDKVPNIITL